MNNISKVSREEFLLEFENIFDETPIASLSLSTNYKDLDEWSSLIVLSIIAHFEEKFSIVIAPKTIYDNETFNELYNSISQA